MTKAEKWFGKKKKDLTPEQLKEFWRLDAQERRRLPKVKEYRKKYQKQYKKDHKEKINQSIKDWKQKHPEKVKGYRYAKLNREIEILELALEMACDEINKRFTDIYCATPEYLKIKAKEKINEKGFNRPPKLLLSCG